MAGALVLTHGLPGAGKSSLGELLRERYGSLVSIAERDEIRLELFGPDYFTLDQYLPANEVRVAETQHTRIRDELARGQLVVASDTNLHELRIRELASIALEVGAPILDLHLDISKAEAERRNEHRSAGGGRLVPQDVIDGMAVYGYSGDRIRHFSVRFDPTLPEGFEVIIRDRRESDPSLSEELERLDRFLSARNSSVPAQTSSSSDLPASATESGRTR